MRTRKVGDTTIEYPDEIAFCFNPIVINILGHAWEYVEAVITDVESGNFNSERRVMFGTSCFFDISFYAQSYFDQVDFKKVDYKKIGAQDSGLGRLFSIEMNFYSDSTTLANSFQFNTFIVWGAMKVGEKYNGNRVMTWFKHFPFSVGMYSSTKATIYVVSDGSRLPSIELSDRRVWNIILDDYIDADKELIINLPANGVTASVFDHTFDFTFLGILNESSTVRLLVDDSMTGIYLRWIDRHGYYCYWLFTSGDENRQVTNDGEFIRNNMQDYSYANGYHGGAGRKQRKTEEYALPICAPLIDSDTYDFLFQLATSPVVDMYAGKDMYGVDRWLAVNIAVGSYNKTRAALQDFVCTIILPETNVQGL